MLIMANMCVLLRLEVPPGNCYQEETTAVLFMNAPSSRIFLKDPCLTLLILEGTQALEPLIQSTRVELYQKHIYERSLHIEPAQPSSAFKSQ